MSEPICTCKSCSQPRQYALESIRIAASLLLPVPASDAEYMAEKIVALSIPIMSLIFFSDEDRMDIGRLMIDREYVKSYGEILARAQAAMDSVSVDRPSEVGPT